MEIGSLAVRIAHCSDEQGVRADPDRDRPWNLLLLSLSQAQVCCTAAREPNEAQGGGSLARVWAFCESRPRPRPAPRRLRQKVATVTAMTTRVVEGFAIVLDTRSHHSTSPRLVGIAPPPVHCWPFQSTVTLTSDLLSPLSGPPAETSSRGRANTRSTGC